MQLYQIRKVNLTAVRVSFRLWGFLRLEQRHTFTFTLSCSLAPSVHIEYAAVKTLMQNMPWTADAMHPGALVTTSEQLIVTASQQLAAGHMTRFRLASLLSETSNFKMS